MMWDELPELEQRRQHARARLEILDALVIAVDRRVELMAIVASSPDANEARTELMATLGLSQIQATAVLDLQVRRFATTERQRIVDERTELGAELER